MTRTSRWFRARAYLRNRQFGPSLYPPPPAVKLAAMAAVTDDAVDNECAKRKWPIWRTPN